MRILIANRGEIARRIARTARRLGHEVVGVTTAVDASSVHAHELSAVEVPSYLDGASIIAAATASQADAIHPGYGFLSENAAFARSVVDAGLIWIGPKPEVIESMGSKINARAIATEAGVPLIPGYAESQVDTDLAAAAERIGFPVLIKASAGGGGRGIRIVNDSAGFAAALTEARTEAERAFGDGSVIVERYIQHPRHVEVQLMGDRHGGLVHLGTRECSVQRRYQKLLEEAPAPNLPDATREGLHEAALRLGAAVGYDSAGTVEFVVDDLTGEYFMLEMNTRLQVEHPVTEAITGIDLVEAMIASAAGEPLSPALRSIEWSGHAIEARIAAEDATRGFVPSIGTVYQLEVPSGVRWDAAIEAGSEVTPHFDSMIAKLIVAATDRSGALGALRSALDHLVIDGVVTTAGFHRWLADRPEMIAGRVTTRLLDSTEMPEPVEPAVAEAAAAWLSGTAAPNNPWHSVQRLNLTPHQHRHLVGLRDIAGVDHEVSDDATTSGARHVNVVAVDQVGQRVAVNVAGHTHGFAVVSRTERWKADPSNRHGGGSALTSPFPAAVAEVRVAPGDEVHGGDVLVVIEAMKMLHSLTAPGAATIAEVRVAAGDQVASDQVLITFETEES